MDILETISERYFEARQHERRYRYPTHELITDPFKITAGFIGLIAVDKVIPGDFGVGSALQVGLFASGMITLLAGHAFVTARCLDSTERQRVSLEHNLYEGEA